MDKTDWIFDRMADLEALLETQSTGVIYDDEMVKHNCIWDSNYPEKPERYLEIIKRWVLRW